MLQDNSVSLAKLKTQIDFGLVTAVHTSLDDFGSVTLMQREFNLEEEQHLNIVHLLVLSVK